MIRYDHELFLRGLASYYGMNIVEFANVIGDDAEKLYRFICDYLYNHN